MREGRRWGWQWCPRQLGITEVRRSVTGEGKEKSQCLVVTCSGELRSVEDEIPNTQLKCGSQGRTWARNGDLGTPGPSMMAEVMGVGEVPGGVKTGCPYVCKYSLMMAYNVCIFPCLIPYFFLPELKNCSRSKLEIIFLGVFPPCWLSGVHMF